MNIIEFARNIGETDLKTLRLLKKLVNTQIKELTPEKKPKDLHVKTGTVLICSYCQKRLRGPDNNPGLVELNLVTHVMSKHPDKVVEFRKRKISDFKL